MGYVSFPIDKATLQTIYEIDSKEALELAYRKATGVDILNKTLKEVSAEDIDEFVSFQSQMQIVNQLLGNIPIQPKDFDIKEEVIKTLLQNTEKANDFVKEINGPVSFSPQKVSSEADKKPEKAPTKRVRLRWASKTMREYQRAVCHFVVERHIPITEDQLLQLFSLGPIEKGKVR